MPYIGLDIGTSSTKAVAFDEAWKVLGEVAVPYPTISPKPGWQEQDPDKVILAAIMALKKLVKKICQPPIAIGLSTAMHSLIAVDDKGKPLTRSILWSDNRAAGIATQLKGTPLGKDIYRHTGTPIHPMSPLPKIAWLRQFEPEVFHNTFKFLGIKEYLIFKLFGAYLSDQSMASATGLFDAERIDWHKNSLDFTGINEEQLPQHVSPFFSLNKLNPTIAKHIGIPVETPWFMGASDGCLANFGAGATRSTEAVLSIGTSGAIRVTTHQPVYDAGERIFNYLLFPPQNNLIPATFVTGGASNNGAVIYEWFCRRFFGLSPSAKGMLPHRTAMQKVPMGCEGLHFQPHLLGERAPLWDALATGSFQRIQPHHSLAHFHRAVLEGILLNMKVIGDVLEEVSGPFDVIFANGGFTKMPFWVNMAAEIFGKKIVVSENEGGPALGAAMVAKEGIGMVN